MLLPILEVYVVHHPDDDQGAHIGKAVFEHFHGTVFSGLIGGSVEVYVRSEPWGPGTRAPRPLPFPGTRSLNDLPAPHISAVVPVVSLEMAREVEEGGDWHRYVEHLVAAHRANPNHVGIFPIIRGGGDRPASQLGNLLSGIQNIAAPSGLGASEPVLEMACRDLAQGVTQMIRGPESRMQVFISHTRRESEEEEDVPELIRLVRSIIAETRLRSFFDANDLQPGRNWDDKLRAEASDSALLSLRTDLYASRVWCQREMLLAKQAGMPIVILDSLGHGEERGSFLMDHVPRIPIRESGGGWSKEDIRRGLNLLVDEALKREIWRLHQSLLGDSAHPHVDWWAPHAPEPVTLTHWLLESSSVDVLSDGRVVILHPDPPLGEDEAMSLEQVVSLAGYEGELIITTPRGLAARGGHL